MRRHMLAVGCSISFLLALVSCVSNPTPSDDTNSGSAQSGQGQATSPTVPPTLSVSALQSVTPGAESAFAPPYFEIRERVRKIINPEHPVDGPIVNDDGIVDPNIREAYGDYQKSLLGKRIDRWEGWVITYQATDDGDSATTYSIGITMQEPAAGKQPTIHVTANACPIEKIRLLRIWQEVVKNPQTSFGSCRQSLGSCQRITFSGFVAGLYPDGRVDMTDMIVESLGKREPVGSLLFCVMHGSERELFGRNVYRRIDHEVATLSKVRVDVHLDGVLARIE